MHAFFAGCKSKPAMPVMQVLLATDIPPSKVGLQAMQTLLLAETSDGCLNLGTKQPYLGKAVLLLRGNCSYSVKVC